jgi:ankyrin repeat protein
MKRFMILSVFMLLIYSVSGLAIPISPASQELAKRNIPFSEDRFIYSILHEDTTVVNLFIKAGMSPNLKNQNTGMTALMLAIKSGNRTIVRALLANGAKVDGQENQFGYTPLMLATLTGDSSMVKLLLNYKADLNLKSKKGETAVMLAADNASIEIAKMLVAAGASKYGTGRDKNLITAIVLHDTTKVKQLLTAGANADAVDAKKNSTLYIASFLGYSDIVKLLLDHGAKEKIATALSLSALKGNLELVNIIKEAGHLNAIGPIMENNRIIGLAYDENTDKFYEKKEFFDQNGVGRTEWFEKGKDTPYTISLVVYDKNGIRRGQKISLTGTGIIDAVNERPLQNRLVLAKEVTDPDWNRITNYTPVFEKNVAQYYPSLIKKIFDREQDPEKDQMDPRLNFIYYFENGMKRNLEYYSRLGGPSFIFETEDKNKDGNPEWVIISEWGNWKMSYFDLNDNRIPDKWEYPGLIEFDTNEDGQIDRWVVIDPKTEKVQLDTKDKKVYDAYSQDTGK